MLRAIVLLTTLAALGVVEARPGTPQNQFLGEKRLGNGRTVQLQRRKIEDEASLDDEVDDEIPYGQNPDELGCDGPCPNGAINDELSRRSGREIDDEGEIFNPIEEILAAGGKVPEGYINDEGYIDDENNASDEVPDMWDEAFF